MAGFPGKLIKTPQTRTILYQLKWRSIHSQHPEHPTTQQHASPDPTTHVNILDSLWSFIFDNKSFSSYARDCNFFIHCHCLSTVYLNWTWRKLEFISNIHLWQTPHTGFTNNIIVSAVSGYNNYNGAFVTYPKWYNFRFRYLWTRFKFYGNRKWGNPTYMVKYILLA